MDWPGLDGWTGVCLFSPPSIPSSSLGRKKHSHDHLLAGKQWVADELARAQGDLAFRHVGGWLSRIIVASWRGEEVVVRRRI